MTSPKHWHVSVAWLAGESYSVAVPHTRVKAVRARSRTSLGAPGARSGHRGLYIPAANDSLRYRLASDHRPAATAPSHRTPPAQKIDILHKKLFLNAPLCAKPPQHDEDDPLDQEQNPMLVNRLRQRALQLIGVARVH